MNREQLIAELADIEWEDFEVKEAKSAKRMNACETVSNFCNTIVGWKIHKGFTAVFHQELDYKFPTDQHRAALGFMNRSVSNLIKNADFHI